MTAADAHKREGERERYLDFARNDAPTTQDEAPTVNNILF